MYLGRAWCRYFTWSISCEVFRVLLEDLSCCSVDVFRFILIGFLYKNVRFCIGGIRRGNRSGFRSGVWISRRQRFLVRFLHQRICLILGQPDVRDSALLLNSLNLNTFLLSTFLDIFGSWFDWGPGFLTFICGFYLTIFWFISNVCIIPFVVAGVFFKIILAQKSLNRTIFYRFNLWLFRFSFCAGSWRFRQSFIFFIRAFARKSIPQDDSRLKRFYFGLDIGIVWLHFLLGDLLKAAFSLITSEGFLTLLVEWLFDFFKLWFSLGHLLFIVLFPFYDHFNCVRRFSHCLPRTRRSNLVIVEDGALDLFELRTFFVQFSHFAPQILIEILEG